MKWMFTLLFAVALNHDSHSTIINDYEAEDKCGLDTHIALYHFLGSIQDLNLDVEKRYLNTRLTIHLDQHGQVSRVNSKGGASKSLSFVAANMLKNSFFNEKKCYVKVNWKYQKRW